MTINERFGEILKHKKVSIKDAANLMGKTETYIRKILRPGESFGIEPFRKILNSFPEIDSEWLLEGRGNMFKTSFPEENVQPVTIERLLSIIESQQRTIENLSRR